MLTEEAAMSDPSPAPDTTADAGTESTGHDVPMRSVEDMEDEDGEEEDGEEEREDDDADDGAMAADPSSTFITPPAQHTEGDARQQRRACSSHTECGCWIAATSGLEIDDCGRCPFCLDKPKYGGPGTKRQKCELKQQRRCTPTTAATHASGARFTSSHKLRWRKSARFRSCQNPSSTPSTKGRCRSFGRTSASAAAPAYVLMYYCEGRVPDRTQLATSRQRYYKLAWQ